MSVTRIEIENGDTTIENFSSSSASVKIENSGHTKDDNIATFSLTDQQAKDLHKALDVYIKSRTDS